MESYIVAKKQLDYPLLLLHKLERVLSIRSNIVYTIRSCREESREVYCVGDLYKALNSLYLALARSFRTKRLEELWRKVTREYIKCLSELEELEQKLLWGGSVRRVVNGIELWDGEVYDLLDRECATKIVILMDEFIEEYIDVLDKHHLLITKQFLGGGRER